jgi:beta-1,4-mannooligosaccharide/beta-1,4-mannosyl-N-acetylglucosamine phosphorylase
MRTESFTTAPCVTRYPGNPVLSKDTVPFPSSSIFNAGVAKYRGQYVMVFRNDYLRRPGAPYGPDNGFAGTDLGLAFSDDGLRWEVRPEPFIRNEDVRDGEVSRVYDPRLTVLDGALYLCFAMDTAHGLRGGIGKMKDDFSGMEILSLSVPDNRNMVLFPEKIGGLYCRLERPMPVYSRGGKDRFDTWVSYSPDLRYWGDSKLVLPVEATPWANDKNGPAAPPVKTKHGWLTTYHAVYRDENRGKNGWDDRWPKIYCAGVLLLDLEDPSRVIGHYTQPLIAPDVPEEIAGGYREPTIVPGGMVLEDSGEVKFYYGAADYTECLATADVNELLRLCLENPEN